MHNVISESEVCIGLWVTVEHAALKAGSPDMQHLLVSMLYILPGWRFQTTNRKSLNTELLSASERQLQHTAVIYQT